MNYVILSIAKKEILDNIRNAWLLTVTLIYTALVLLVTYSVSLSRSVDSVGMLISGGGLVSIVTTLVPIIGLMIGYTGVVGELESGSLLLLASHAVSRLDILLGKVIGRGFILVYSIVLGFGIGGILVALNVPNADFGEYWIFIGATILLGFLFFCMGILVSTLFKRRTIAIGVSVALWVLFVLMWPIVVLILLLLLFSDFNITVDTFDFSIPTWFYVVDLINPVTLYTRLIGLTISSTTQLSIVPMHEFYSTELMVGLMALWIVILLVLSWIKFRLTDI